MLYEQKEILYFCLVEKICIKIEKKMENLKYFS